MSLRKNTGWVIVVLFFVVPYLNLFRLDIRGGHYYWLRLRLGFDQPLPLLLTILLLVFLVIGLSTFRARLFCTALCPHNTVSKALRSLQKWGWDTPVAILLTPFVAFTLVSYFSEPHFAWRGIFYGESHMAQAFFAVLCVFLGFLLLKLRTKFCQLACPYGFFQNFFTPEHPTGWMKAGVGAVLLLLATGMTVAALSTTASEVSFRQLSRVQTGTSMTYLLSLSLSNNSASHDEQFQVRFASNSPLPIGDALKSPIHVAPGETKQIPFAMRTSQLEILQFDVCSQTDGTCKHFNTTLSGP